MDWSTAIKLTSSKDNIPIDNHFKLCAGPGAGKTTFLIQHIRRILHQSDRLSRAKKIACITYTNTGVETIRSRLKEIADNVEVTTIHSFLYNHIVKPYLWVLDDVNFPLDKLDGHDEIKPGYQLLREYKQQSGQQWINDDQQLSIALSKLTWTLNNQGNLELKLLKPFYGKIGKTNIRKASYIIFKKICWNKGLMSHDDVLYFSYLIIKKREEVKDIIRAKFPYFLIDEFQDTNPIQGIITKLIAERETIVGVIGDPCQSIFSFQGTDENIFNQFSIEGMENYILENNHRSTQEIISVLNLMRNDYNFVQRSPDRKIGKKPILIIGDAFSAYHLFKSQCNSENWCVLGYRNNVTNGMKYDVRDDITTEIDLFYKDNERGKRIHYIIHAIEYGKQMKLKEAIKFMKKAFRSVEHYSDKEALKGLKELLNNYEQIYSLNIKDFYNSYIFNTHGVKQKITSGKISDFYQDLKYEKAATMVNITDDQSSFKTIHKAKGDEFEDVFVVVPNHNERNYLDFLLSPDMSKEEHRVYYVALSRAKSKLYISIPKLPVMSDDLELLDKFEVVVLNTEEKNITVPVVN